MSIEVFKKLCQRFSVHREILIEKVYLIFFRIHEVNLCLFYLGEAIIWNIVELRGLEWNYRIAFWIFKEGLNGGDACKSFTYLTAVCFALIAWIV